MQRTAHLFPTPTGLALAGEIIAPRNPDGSFVFAEAKIHALLSAAYSKTVSSRAMSYVKRGSELLAQVSTEELERAAYPYFPNPHAQASSEISVLAKSLMLFALSGLNDIEDMTAGKTRLAKMLASSEPDALLKSYGLPTWAELAKDEGDDSGDDEGDDSGDGSDSSDGSSDFSDGGDGGGNGHYNPDEPRVPAGQPGGGEWTSGDDASSAETDRGSISADDIRSALIEGANGPSSLPQGTEMASNDAVASDASSDNGSTKLSTEQVGNIIFNETRSLSSLLGSDIDDARLAIAYMIRNGEEWADQNDTDRPITAGDSIPNNVPVSELSTYHATQAAASQVDEDTKSAADPTNGAIYMYIASNNQHVRYGTLTLSTGPFQNSFPNKDVPYKTVYINFSK